MERFGDAYTAQLENFAQNVLHDREPPITVDDGVEALRVAIAATRAQKTGQRVEVAPSIEESAGRLTERCAAHPASQPRPAEGTDRNTALR